MYKIIMKCSASSIIKFVLHLYFNRIFNNTQSTQKALGNTNCTIYQCDYQNLLVNMKKIQRYILLNLSHISLNFIIQ